MPVTADKLDVRVGVLLGLLAWAGLGAMGENTAPVDAQLAGAVRQYNAVRKRLPEFFATPWEWNPTAAPEEVPGASDCEAMAPAELDAYIEEMAKKEGYTPDLLRAVIQRESSYQPCAVSAKGAQGLMQLMPATAGALGVQDAFNPRQNIEGGARYLGALLDRYKGDLSLALAAYNAGPAVVDQYQGLPPIPETMNYVRDILAALGKGSPPAAP
jgi:soluble lytic murein transglycosylase-like protein